MLEGYVAFLAPSSAYQRGVREGRSGALCGPGPRCGRESGSRRAVVLAANVADGDGESAGSGSGFDSASVEAFRAALKKQVESEWVNEAEFNGYELQKLLREKWDRCYDIQIKVTDWVGDERLLTVNIMWRYMEQQSFPMAEPEYLEHLQAVSDYLREWQAVPDFVEFVRAAKRRPRVGMAVAVPIDVSPETINKFINELAED